MVFAFSEHRFNYQAMPRLLETWIRARKSEGRRVVPQIDFKPLSFHYNFAQLRNERSLSAPGASNQDDWLKGDFMVGFKRSGFKRLQNVFYNCFHVGIFLRKFLNPRGLLVSGRNISDAALKLADYAPDVFLALSGTGVQMGFRFPLVDNRLLFFAKPAWNAGVVGQKAHAA